MASAPSNPGPILGRVDGSGRLVAADPELERLQVEAGSQIGASIALPQLAAIVRVAQRLRIPVSRRLLAAGREQDVDMWVRAVPEDDQVALMIEQWSSRPAASPRLAAIVAVEQEMLASQALAWSVDEQLRFASIAPALAHRLSIDPAEAAGQPLTKLFRLEESESGDMPLLDALAARQDFAGQRVRVRNGGAELLLSGNVLLAPDGAFAGFDGSATMEPAAPVAARPTLDSAIQTALRSPLDKIVESAREMRETPKGEVSEEYAAYASDIATAAHHLLSVIRSLGEQSQSGGGSRVDLIELTSEAIGLIETAAKERSILLGVQPARKLFASGESRSVVQILVNLIGNAVRYAPEGSAVTVSFEHDAGGCKVHVADQGPGISPADQERVFEPFQKGSEGGEGSGLGLAIARRLARGMGGEIELKSEAGAGSRFTLTLPAA
jgi:signal transduction histidine kinase